MEMEWMMPIVMIMVVVIIVMMVVRMIKDMAGKKKPQKIEIARDSDERLEKHTPE